MASAAKIAANRANAQKSTGPRTAAGKARARHNAYQHGLSIPATFEPGAADHLDHLIIELARFTDDELDDAVQDAAVLAAEAQLDLDRVRRAKVDLVNQATRFSRDKDCPVGERVALAFATHAKTLAAFDRYERRALSRRRRAMRILSQLGKARLQERLAERNRVGPPRPKQPPKNRNELFTWRTLALDLNSLLKPLARSGSGSYPLSTSTWKNNNGEFAQIQFRARLTDDEVVITAKGHVEGNEFGQEIAASRRRTKVGGVVWSSRCPETGKNVWLLYYCIPRGQRFRSRHALGLVYRSSTITQMDRYVERFRRSPPPRPKYMHHRTYERLITQLANQKLRSNAARLKCSPADLLKQAEANIAAERERKLQSHFG